MILINTYLYGHKYGHCNIYIQKLKYGRLVDGKAENKAEMKSAYVFTGIEMREGLFLHRLKVRCMDI